MATHSVVSREEWTKARLALLEREKELTELRDQVSAERRQLPWVRIDKDYRFATPAGTKSLGELFEGRHTLVVYHFMLGPGWSEGCPSCSYLMDHVDGMLPHLNARGVTFSAVSRAPLPEIERFKTRMEWGFPWASSFGTDFNYDFHVSFGQEDLNRGSVEYNFSTGPAPVEDLPGLSVFTREPSGEVFHTYSGYARGLDILLGTYNYLDMTPRGRDEESLAFSMAWVRHHDKYGTDYKVDPQAGYVPPVGAAVPHCCGCES